ncbi:MAG: VCBS repeat-containing protein [bacterium]|nr:VCBS repeat-containing protein [bacterium]
MKLRAIPEMRRLPGFLLVGTAALLAASGTAANRDRKGDELRAPVLATAAYPAPTARATVDSVVLARFDFDDAQGGADPQGWTMHDRSAEYLDEPFWHVDDFAGLAGYAPLAGVRSLWCGARVAPDGLAGGTWPGYGNRWVQYFESATFAVTGDVQVSCLARYETESGYDWLYLEYRSGGSAWMTLNEVDGLGQGSFNGTIDAGAHDGEVQLRLRFVSDNAWSDEDGFVDTLGAVVIDELTVADGTGVVDHQDFEAEAVAALATVDGHWTARVDQPFGLHAGLVAGDDVLQQDPAVYNATNFWSFFNGSGTFFGCAGTTAQEVVPYNTDDGSGPYTPVYRYFSNDVRSPWIRLDQDEAGSTLSVPPEAVSLQFQVYRDFEVNNELYYKYRARFRIAGEMSNWYNDHLVYYGPQKDWFSARLVLAVPAGADEIQISLGAVDAAWQFTFPGSCHTHAPLFDNVRLVAAVVDEPIDIAAGLVNTAYGDVDWGDYDGDGDLDILVVGATNPGKAARVYRNDGGVFADIAAPLTAISHGSAEWGDYDNDGDLDILLAGDTGNEEERAVTRLYRNDAGAFIPVSTSIPGLMGDFADRGLAWGDYDNDGDLDILLMGRGFPGNPEQYHGAIHRNDGAGVFTEIATGLPALSSCAVAPGDYDVDGDLDLALCGELPDGNVASRIYRNDGAGQFTDIGAGLAGVHSGGAAWGDYDNDGDPDLALTGLAPGNTYVSRIYRNDAGLFTDLQAALPDLGGGSVDWGDYDADGDLDLLLTGWNGTVRLSRIYRNDNGTFVDEAAGLPGTIYGSAGWGDFDGDGRLDILLAGYNPTDGFLTRIYRNWATPAASPPPLPTNVTASVEGDVVTLSWTVPAAAKSASDGLTFNVRLGTTPGGGEICSGQVEAATGRRLVARPGNAGQSLSWSVQMAAGWTQVYGSVQSIGSGYAGSPFSTELMVTPAGVAAAATPLPYVLHANAPNPFNPRTTLSFTSPRDGHARLEIFDAQGRRVRVLLDSVVAAGRHDLDWDGRDGDGRELASGVYLYRLDAGEFRRTMRMTLIR